MKAPHTSKRFAGYALMAFGVLALTPEPAPAELRYRVDGNACHPSKDSSSWHASSQFGLAVTHTPGSSNSMSCAIPQASGTVRLSGSHKVDSVSVYVKREEDDGTVSTYLRVRDTADLDYCTCGSDTQVLTANSYGVSQVDFDCGSCSYSSSWTLAAQIYTELPGVTYVKRIDVND
jgi:hypothetical protein